MRTLRLIVTVLSAPAAAAMAFCVLWLASLLLLVSPSSRGVATYSDLATKLPEAWPIILYAYVSALLLEIILGLPLLLLFRRMGWLSFQGFMIGGCLVALAFYAAMHESGSPVDLAVRLVLSLVPGCVGALAFGYVGGWLTSRLSGPT